MNFSKEINEVANDFFKAARESTPDIGAHEYGGVTLSAPSTLRIEN